MYTFIPFAARVFEYEEGGGQTDVRGCHHHALSAWNVCQAHVRVCTQHVRVFSFVGMPRSESERARERARAREREFSQQNISVPWRKRQRERGGLLPLRA